MRALSIPLVCLLLLTSVLCLSHVQVHAIDRLHRSPALRLLVARNNSAPSTSQVSKKHGAAKQGVPLANDTTIGSGKTGALADIAPPCPEIDSKRSWMLKGRSVVGCAVPSTLQPADGLVPADVPVPESSASSEKEGKTQPISASEPQAMETNSQSNPQKTSTPNAGSQQTESLHTGSLETNNQQMDSSQNGQQTSSQETDSRPKDTQPVQITPNVKSEPASPVVAAAPNSPSIIVQGQTIPADGSPITVNNQVVKMSSGFIHVGTLSEPIPVAQVTPPSAQPIIAGTLTFQPAAANPTPRVASSPFVVGGLTFSAALPVSPDEPLAVPNLPQSRPVVVGGKVYAPIPPTPQSGTSQAADSTVAQEDSKSSISQEPNKSGNNDQKEPVQQAHADSEPIVIGGMTYTPVAANPTSQPQHGAVFSFSGTAITQGGEAITISGTRVSLGPSGVIIGKSSLPISTPAPTTSMLTIGSKTLTALRGSSGGFEIDHSTLLPGSSAITISGTIYSINPAGSLIIGTSTIPLATADSSNASNSALTAGGETFTPLDSTAVVVAGTTLSIGGPAITENGTKVSLASNGLIVGTSTFAYATPAANTATVPTASGGAFSTGALPSGTATISTFPSATGSLGTSAAFSNFVVPKFTMAVLGISSSLLFTLGIL